MVKPDAYLWNIPDVPKDAQNKQYLYFKDPSCACGQIFKKDITTLYTAHKIAEFVKGLYFDESFHQGVAGQSIYSSIAEKIEEEAK